MGQQQMKTTEEQAPEAAPEAPQADLVVISAAAVSDAPNEVISASSGDVSHENAQAQTDTDKSAVAGSPEKTAKTPVQTKTMQSPGQRQAQPPQSAKKDRPTPAKPAATMPSKAKVSSRSMDELHERRIVKEPTLFERALAKQEKAKSLLSAQPAVASETSSSTASSETKKAPLRKTSEQTPGRLRAKSTATTVKPVSAVKTPLASTLGRTVTPSSSGESKLKRAVTYKPYTGPVPPFQGDSLFTPKKPRAVASKTTTPSRTPRPLSAIKSRQQNSASKKQGSNTPTPANGKENAQPQEQEETAVDKSDPPEKDADVEKVKPSPRSAALRVPVKESSSKKKMTESASKTRREKYLQDGQTKASIARQAARSGLEANSTA